MTFYSQWKVTWELSYRIPLPGKPTRSFACFCWERCLTTFADNSSKYKYIFYKCFTLTAFLSATFIVIKKSAYTNLNDTGFPLEFRLCRTKAFCYNRNFLSHWPPSFATAFGKLNYMQAIQKCNLAQLNL